MNYSTNQYNKCNDYMPKELMQKKKKIIAGVIGAIVFVVLAHWLITRGTESTDDATIDAYTIPISAKVPGYIAVLNVKDNQQVKKGDVLAEIDPRDYELRLDVAKAAFAAAQVAANNAAINAKRRLSVGRIAASQKEVDDALAAEASTKAAMDSAGTEVAIAEKNLADTKIIAPSDGVIAMRTAEQGAYAETGKQLFVLVGNERWVVANFKEVQIADMLPGQHVDIHVDAYPGLKLEGRVDSIQAGTGAQFSAFPPENATGNFVKIVQRVPVKINITTTIPDNVVLGAGLSVQPTVHTGYKPK